MLRVRGGFVWICLIACLLFGFGSCLFVVCWFVVCVLMCLFGEFGFVYCFTGLEAWLWLVLIGLFVFVCLIVLVVYFDVMVCYLIVVDCAFLLLLFTVGWLVLRGGWFFVGFLYLLVVHCL